MAGKNRSFNPVQVNELVTAIIDPVLAKRAGITTSLIQAWDEIAGENLGACSRPEKIKWGQRKSAGEPFEPATLIIACEGSAALQIQHQTSEIMARINSFLGFSAIASIRIVQKPVAVSKKPKPPMAPLTDGERQKISATVSGIDDDRLRAALERLGENVVGSRK